MSLPIKLGATCAVGAGATATYFGVFHFAMPAWSPLSKDSDATSAYSSSKYGENYQQFLVGMGTTASDNTQTILRQITMLDGIDLLITDMIPKMPKADLERL